MRSLLWGNILKFLENWLFGLCCMDKSFHIHLFFKGWTLGPGRRTVEVPTINGMVLLVAQRRYGVIFVLIFVATE